MRTIVACGALALHIDKIAKRRGWDLEVKPLPPELHAYYRFTTFEQAMGDFLGPVWKSRLLTDPALYPLVW